MNNRNCVVAVFALAGVSTAGDLDPFPGRIVKLGISTAFNAVHMGAADLDADGLQDVVVLSTDSEGPPATATGRMHIALQNEAGFDVAQELVGPNLPVAPVFGDVDGDGVLDVIAGTRVPGAQRNYVYLGTGDGGMQAPGLKSMGGTPALNALADINNDGDLDLVVGYTGANAFGVALGNGTGSFSVPAPIAIPAEATAVAVDDLDQDGWLDVVLAAGSAGVRLYRGDGMGSLLAGVVIAADVNAEGLLLDDLSDDGVLDLAAVERAGVTRLLIGNSGGGFAPLQSFATEFPDGFTGPVGLAKSAANAEGESNLVVYGGDVYLLESLVGGLGLPEQLTIPSEGFRYQWMGDLTGDGADDLASLREDRFDLYTGDGTGRFHLPEPRAAVNYMRGFAVGDVTGDGVLDAVGASDFISISAPPPGTQGISIVRGDSAGGLENVAFYPLETGVRGVDTGDLNGDGVADIAAIGADLPVVATLLGNANGLPDDPVLVPTSGIGYYIAMGDLNGDGDVDVVFPDFTSLSAHLGDGTGALGAPIVSDEASEAYITALKLVDVNLDGTLDVYRENSYAGVAVSIGDGAGGFVLGPDLGNLSSYVSGIAVLDVQGDGLPDLAAFAENSNRTYVWVNQGGGVFAEPWFRSMNPNSDGLAAGDFDGDGAVDLVSGGSLVTLMRGDGSGGFEDSEIFDSPASYSFLETADWDADGREDVVFGTYLVVAPGVQLLDSLIGDPAGVERYGSGTSGCAGAHGLAAVTSAELGGTLHLTCTQTPATTVGLMLLGAQPDVAGSDVFGLGVLSHINLAAGGFLFFQPMVSDLTGYAQWTLPIPQAPVLEGLELFAQVYWDASVPCPTQPTGLSSSNGLALTFE